MEPYRTEEEQVEDLKRWWQENGRSTLMGIVVAAALVFGWQGWQEHRKGQAEAASDLYQRLLEAAGNPARKPAVQGEMERLAERLKADYSGTTYAQFAALQLAQLAVADDDLEAAEGELRWVLAAAGKDSDAAWIARQRLARVLAASGDTDGALATLDAQGDNPYQATYAMVRGDILYGAGRDSEALAAYQLARQLVAEHSAQMPLPSLERKLASLQPVEPRELAGAPAATTVEDARETRP
ncbi:MAG: YfgM family protein [Parahaliea sp.]